MCRLCNDLRKIKQLFTHTKETNITPELSLTYKHLSFPQVEHRKLLFGDDLPKAIKELNETNKIGQCLSKKSYFQSSPIGSSSIFTNSNTAGWNSGKNSNWIIRTAIPVNHTSSQATEAIDTRPLLCERSLWRNWIQN